MYCVQVRSHNNWTSSVELNRHNWWNVHHVIGTVSFLNFPPRVDLFWQRSRKGTSVSCFPQGPDEQVKRPPTTQERVHFCSVKIRSKTLQTFDFLIFFSLKVIFYVGRKAVYMVAAASYMLSQTYTDILFQKGSNVTDILKHISQTEWLFMLSNWLCFNLSAS